MDMDFEDERKEKKAKHDLIKEMDSSFPFMDAKEKFSQDIHKFICDMVCSMGLGSEPGIQDQIKKMTDKIFNAEITNHEKNGFDLKKLSFNGQIKKNIQDYVTKKLGYR